MVLEQFQKRQVYREELWEAFAAYKKSLGSGDELATEAAKTRILQYLRDYWDISVSHEIKGSGEVFGWGCAKANAAALPSLLSCFESAVRYAIWVEPTYL